VEVGASVGRSRTGVGRGGSVVAIGQPVILKEELCADVIVPIDLVVETRKEDVLLEFTRRRAAETVEVGLGGVTLRTADGCRTGEGGDWRRRAVKQWAGTAEAIVGEEVEELVLKDRTTYRATELVLLVHGGLEESWIGSGLATVVLGQRIECVQRRIAKVVEEIPMDGVGAGLGDGVNLSAGGLTELGRVARGGGFKLFDGVLREDVGSADSAATSLGEEGLLVVGPIDQIGVVKAGDAAIGDETGVAVGDYVGGEKNEVVVAAAIDG
jgi:hypothetical protein